MKNRATWLVVAAAVVGMPVLADDKPVSPPKAPDTKTKYVEVGRAEGKVARIDVQSSELTVYPNRVGRGYSAQQWTLAPECKVFTVAPPQRIDENGNSKKWTKEELRKIESRAPGTKGLYPAELKDVHGNQQVIVVISKPKDAVKKPSSASKGKSSPDKEFIYVTQIIIKADDSGPPAKPKKP